MKLAATALTVLLTSLSFSQSSDLIVYQFDTDEKVEAIKVTAKNYDPRVYNPLGNIECVYGSSITLELNMNLDYHVLINNKTLVEITKDELATYARGEEYNLESATNANDLVYRVQLVALSKEKSYDYFEGLGEISTEKIDEKGMIRYMTGNFEDINSANASLNSIRQTKYKNAFVVAYVKGERVTVNEALAYEGSLEQKDSASPENSSLATK